MKKPLCTLFEKQAQAPRKRRRALKITIQNELARPWPKRLTPAQLWRVTQAAHAHGFHAR